jgi:hypothetical protein
MRKPLLPALLAVAAVYAISTLIAFSSWSTHTPVAIGIACDLTLTSAALFWLLAVRPGHARPRALIRVVLLGVALARLLVGIRALGVIGIAVEAAVMVWLVVRVRRIVRRTRELRRAGLGLAAALEDALCIVFGVRAVASVLAVEIATVVYATTGWFRSPGEGFTMHRRSGYLLFVGVIVVLAVVEMVGTHVVLMRVAPTVAIVATILSAYSLLWLVGVAHAVRLSPLRFTPSGVVIERGVLRRTIVPEHAIARAVPVATGSADAIDLSYVEPNVLLELSAPVEVHGLFGRKRSATKLLLSIDDRDAFLARLSARSTRA